MTGIEAHHGCAPRRGARKHGRLLALDMFLAKVVATKRQDANGAMKSKCVLLQSIPTNCQNAQRMM